MNANEVIENIATKKLGADVHPNDDVNMSQSSNDTIPTAICLSTLYDMEEYLQTEWPHLQVYVNSITEQFSTFNISGPKSREIVSKVFTDVDFSNENFPFMTFKVFDYMDTEVRVMRVLHASAFSIV